MTSEKTAPLQRLLEAAREMSLSADTEKYLQSILSAAVELTASETASILEFDEAAKELRFAIVPWFQQDAIKGVHVSSEGSAAGMAFKQGKPVKVDDVDKDERRFLTMDIIANVKTRSLLAVPVFYRGVPIGVFETVNKLNSAHYTEEDVAILETLASLASAAMQNDRLEKSLQSSAGAGAELDRLKSDFIAITSHELRTPLGLILGHATFLREMLGKEYAEQLESIVRNATRLKEIIESLSNMDNYETGAARLRQKKISILRVAEDVIASFQSMAAEKKIKLKTELGSDDLAVDGDATKISIALSNLVKNAITFTNKGGQVLVKAERMDDYVKVSVIDNGVGIPARDVPRVFEKFFQVESHLTRRHGGMGLGLSVAKVMIDLHHGRIWAESVEGKGSNFSFLIPVDAQSSAT